MRLSTVSKLNRGPKLELPPAELALARRSRRPPKRTCIFAAAAGPRGQRPSPSTEAAGASPELLALEEGQEDVVELALELLQPLQASTLIQLPQGKTHPHATSFVPHVLLQPLEELLQPLALLKTKLLHEEELLQPLALVNAHLLHEEEMLQPLALRKTQQLSHPREKDEGEGSMDSRSPLE